MDKKQEIKHLNCAIKCLEQTEKSLVEGNDITARSALYQLCKQLEAYAKQQGNKDFAKAFKKRAKVIKKLPLPRTFEGIMLE